jgi:hypothetical protein
MSEKWTREEFEVKKLTLLTKKDRKKKLRGTIGAAANIVITIGVPGMLCKIADLVY